MHFKNCILLCFSFVPTYFPDYGTTIVLKLSVESQIEVHCFVLAKRTMPIRHGKTIIAEKVDLHTYDIMSPILRLFYVYLHSAGDLRFYKYVEFMYLVKVLISFPKAQ